MHRGGHLGGGVRAGTGCRAGVCVPGMSVSLWSAMSVLDLLWPFLPLGGAAALAHLLAEARRTACLQKVREAGLAATSAEQVARRAVAEERQRLLLDVHQVIRAALVSMLVHARAAQTPDSLPACAHAQAVQRDGRQAITELRRLLGLLRDTPEESSAPAPDHPRPPRAVLRPVDVALAACVAALAGLEPWLWREDFDSALPPPTTTSIALSALGGAAIVLRRANPGAGAAAVGLLLGVSVISDAPVEFGFGMLIAGLTLPLVDPSFTPDGATSVITDGTSNTNRRYLDRFPYLGTPAGGYQTKPGIPAV